MPLLYTQLNPVDYRDLTLNISVSFDVLEKIRQYEKFSLQKTPINCILIDPKTFNLA